MYFKWDADAKERYEKGEKVSFSAFKENTAYDPYKKKNKYNFPYLSVAHVEFHYYPNGEVSAEYVDDAPSYSYGEALAWRNYGNIAFISEYYSYDDFKSICEMIGNDFVKEKKIFDFIK